jgi:hypothetical protein
MALGPKPVISSAALPIWFISLSPPSLLRVRPTIATQSTSSSPRPRSSLSRYQVLKTKATKEVYPQPKISIESNLNQTLNRICLLGDRVMLMREIPNQKSLYMVLPRLIFRQNGAQTLARCRTASPPPGMNRRRADHLRATSHPFYPTVS